MPKRQKPSDTVPDTVVAENALLHGEALLVIATTNSEDVALSCPDPVQGKQAWAHVA